MSRELGINKHLSRKSGRRSGKTLTAAGMNRADMPEPTKQSPWTTADQFRNAPNARYASGDNIWEKIGNIWHFYMLHNAKTFSPDEMEAKGIAITGGLYTLDEAEEALGPTWNTKLIKACGHHIKEKDQLRARIEKAKKIMRKSKLVLIRAEAALPEERETALSEIADQIDDIANFLEGK